MIFYISFKTQTSAIMWMILPSPAIRTKIIKLISKEENLLTFACLFTFYACLFIFRACLCMFYLGANHKALTFHVTLWWICS